MGISKQIFGECNGNTVYSYTLTNNSGLVAEILNYGGIIRRLSYKGVDVALGLDRMEDYLYNPSYFGALIGRNSNRIENAEFELGGKICSLYANDGSDNLHGGKIGFDKKIWNAEAVDGDEPSLVLTTVSPDGEEGFPGTVNVRVVYTIAADNSLRIEYTGESDADTVLNMTNHTYFNLNGHSDGNVDGHKLWLNCDFYTPNTEACIPTGEVLKVENTPFDFTSPQVLGNKFESEHEQIKMFGGFDHNFIINGRGFKKAGKIEADKTGIAMEIYTDRIGMQVYSGNSFEDGRTFKAGAIYGAHQGICFETQAFPNCMNFSHFPDAFLKKGEKYHTVTWYKFI